MPLQAHRPFSSAALRLIIVLFSSSAMCLLVNAPVRTALYQSSLKAPPSLRVVIERISAEDSLGGRGFWGMSLGGLGLGGKRNKTQETKKQFPRDLHDLYDGEWKMKGGGRPFQQVPLVVGEGRNSSQVSKYANRTVDKWAFQNNNGFALLTVQSRDSSLGNDIILVAGELLIRDGTYRTDHDVNLRVLGVYEWTKGSLVLVGDVLYEDTNSALQRLFKQFAKLHSHAELDRLAKRNVTQEAFVAALSPFFTKLRKQSHAQRAGTIKRVGVDSQCPFSATISIADRSIAGEAFGGYKSAASGMSVSVFSNSAVASQGPAGTFKSDFASPSITELPPRKLRSALGNAGAQGEYVLMKGSFFSQACKTQLELDLSTLDKERLFGKAINYTLLVTFVAFAQVLVLIRQMEMTSTQAGASRVSLMTVGLQAVSDSYLCLGHLTLGIAVQPLFNAFATAAFFKFIIFSIFEMRYMLLIWKARRPSAFSEGWDAMRRELSVLYSRFYGSLLFGIFLLYQLQNHLRFFIFSLYSFWVPQIVLSIYEDHRRPLHLVYIVGMSVTRLAIPLYFWSCPYNFLHIQPQPMTAVALSAWVLFQSIVLITQHRFGARWFVPKAFLPEKYDYYREIDIDAGYDLEAQNFVTEGEEQDRKVTEVDCVICMGRVKLKDADRMATPCDHCFHSQCLQNWLDIKMECPTCRRVLPPP